MANLRSLVDLAVETRFRVGACMWGARESISSETRRHRRMTLRDLDGIATVSILGGMSAVFAAEAVRVHDEARLPHDVIAEAVGAAPSTVRDWLAGRSSPTGERARRVAELAEITDRLGRVIDPDYIQVWLLKPVAALDDYRPIDLLAGGQARRVARLITGLESPGAS